MIDGIRILKKLSTDFKIDETVFSSIKGHPGFYVLKQHQSARKKLKLTVRILNGKDLVIEGSLPYFTNGNNFEFVTRASAIDSINELEAILQISLWDAEVTRFEFGVIVETPFNFGKFNMEHTGIAGMVSINQGKKMRIFDLGDRAIKIYDAHERLKQVSLSSMREKLKLKGFYDSAKNYIKFEVIYKKPQRYFQITRLTLQELFDESFWNVLGDDLYESYKSVRKNGICVPKRNKDFDAVSVLTALCLQMSNEYGFDLIAESNKIIDNAHCLSPTNRYDRRKIIEKTFVKLKSEKVESDISELLKQRLAQN